LVCDIGPDETPIYFDGILDHADKMMRGALSALANGVYRAEERYISDCFQPMDIRIRVAVTIEDDSAVVDFTGTHPQIRGFKNSSLANTHSAVYAAFASFFPTDIPRNEGTFRSLRIIAPLGSLVNARPPAPLTMCTVFPAHEIMHGCWWALGQADPSRNIAGWGKNCFPVSSGSNSDGSTWVMYHWGGNSGAGAVRGRDGFNQMGTMVTLGGLVMPNAESYEQIYPVRVLRQEFRCDGGGAGEYRGGTGVEYEVEIETPAEHSFRSEGVGRPTGRGVEGGYDGAEGELHVTESGEDLELPQYALRQLGPIKLVIASAGGGGFGDPLMRDPAAVLRDVRDEVVTIGAAREIYGVVISQESRSFDEAATFALRKRKKGSLEHSNKRAEA
jgi:N-methylhydantoinase B